MIPRRAGKTQRIYAGMGNRAKESKTDNRAKSVVGQEQRKN